MCGFLLAKKNKKKTNKKQKKTLHLLFTLARSLVLPRVYRKIKSKAKSLYDILWSSFLRNSNPLDTWRKLNVNTKFRRHPGRLLNALCTLNLRPVSRGNKVPEKQKTYKTWHYLLNFKWAMQLYAIKHCNTCIVSRMWIAWGLRACQFRLIIS